MCFGGGGGVAYIPPEYFYEQIKEDYGPLPSLRMERSNRARPKLKDVGEVRGMPRRSLLNPAGDLNV